MECDFYKMNGLGNDFVVLDRMSQSAIDYNEDYSAIARRVCDRRRSVGADGLLVISNGSDGYDARMRIFNADGSEAQMCGNGIRCVALHVHSRTGLSNIRIATMSGIRNVRTKCCDDIFYATVDMGAPVFNPSDIPVIHCGDSMLDTTIAIGNHTFAISAVSMGNPHGVVFVDNVDATDVASLGPLLENADIWPQKANIEFAEIVDLHHIKMRAWERGVGETDACGTGACAVAAVAVATGRADYPIEIGLPGGKLLIDTDKQGHTMMCGPAEYCFKGTFKV